MKQVAGSSPAATAERVLNSALANVNCSLRLGENVGLALVSETDSVNFRLHPEEMRLLSPRACPGKRAKFILGRAAARLAMKQIGIESPGPLLRGSGGEPVWCEGVVGSITHCSPWSAAAVVKSSHPLAVGVDLETVQSVRGTDISRLVCLDAELAWVQQGDFDERLAMIFSAKEALFKALYPLCRRYIDFLEVGLRPLIGQAGFQGEILPILDADLPLGDSISVHCRRSGEYVFSCALSRFYRNRTDSNAASFIHSDSWNHPS